jgi:peptidoglycan/xylan/chitin deacetylase (PgdA/CDA1 family)
VNSAVALTYDDGPDPFWTDLLLAELREQRARATFFVMTPRARLAPDLIEAMLADGHEVGLHCVRHVRHSELGGAELRAELATGLADLASHAVEPRAWRAPWGVETAATRTLAADHGLRLWGWNFDSHDWRGDAGATMHAALNAQGGLRGGDVVLMHDGVGPGAQRAGCGETLELTRLVLADAARQGLRCVPVSEADGAAA